MSNTQTKQTLTDLLANEWNISGSRWGGGTQELMLGADGKVWTTSHSQNSWSEYHTPTACLLVIDSNTDWSKQEGEFDRQICEDLGWFSIYEHSVPEEDKERYLEGELTAQSLIDDYSLSEYEASEAIHFFLSEREYENNNSSDDILLYLQENETLEVPVLEEVPNGYTKEEIESAHSRTNSFPEYSWTMYAVYNEKDEFVGIYSEED